MPEKRLCIIVLFLLPTIAGQGAHWETTIIASSASGFGFPKISSGRLVWTQDDGSDSEVFLYDEGIITQVTDNEVDDLYPDVSGEHIAWYQSIPESERRFPLPEYRLLLDGETIAEGLPSFSMILEREGMLWSAPTRSYAETRIFYFDGLDTKKWGADETRHNYNPAISGANVVWSGFDDTGNHAYLYDGSTVKQLPEGVGLGQTPRISGDTVTGILVNSEGYIHGVTRYDISEDELTTYEMGLRFVSTPSISDHFMAWVATANGNTQVFLLDEEQPLQLSFGPKSTFAPFVTQSVVAWGTQGSQGDVFAYDGKSVTMLTDGKSSNTLLDADGNQLVWLRYGESTTEIVMATLLAPEPSGIVILGTVGIVILSSRHPVRW